MPCALFTDEQARVLGILEPGSPRIEPDSAECLRFSIPQNDLVVSYYFGTDLLGRIYARDTNWPTKGGVVPLTIGGQPAVRTTIPEADTCRVAFALTDDQGVEIQVRYTIADACPRAVRVAETIVRNVGG